MSITISYTGMYERNTTTISHSGMFERGIIKISHTGVSERDITISHTGGFDILTET
jgi:hypothetical protein